MSGVGIAADELAKLIADVTGQPAPAATVAALSCRVCGERLDAIHAEVGTHPLCDPQPAAVASPPSILGELAHVLVDFDANRPRSLQTTIGPSQIAVPCDRRLGYAMSNTGQRPDGRVKWAPLVGTAVHALIAEALEADNVRLGRQRWLVEQRVNVDDQVSGECDCYDVDNDTVIDWKIVGPSTLDSVRPTERRPDRTPSAQYIGQVQLYARGWQRAGRTPRFVRIVFLPRTTFYEDAVEWTAPYDKAAADGALDRMYRTRELLKTLDVVGNPGMWAAVPASPGKLCGYCPYLRRGYPAADDGCPGDVEADAAKADRFTDGIIAR